VTTGCYKMRLSERGLRVKKSVRKRFKQGQGKSTWIEAFRQFQQQNIL